MSSQRLSCSGSSVKLPSVVLEVVAGIVIGPSVLAIVEVDESISVIAVIGLAFLLFLAGLEIEFDKLRGQVLRLTLIGADLPRIGPGIAPEARDASTAANPEGLTAGAKPITKPIR